MILTDFSKGVFNRVNLHKIPKGWAEISHNNDSVQVSLVPIRDSVKVKDTEGTTGFYSHVIDDLVTGGDDCYWTETCNELYKVDKDGMYATRMDKGTYPVGIEEPTDILTVISGSKNSPTTLTLEEARPLADRINSMKSLMNETNDRMTPQQALAVVNQSHPDVTYSPKELEMIVHPSTLVNAVALSHTPETSELDGTYAYRYTYFDAKTGYESSPSSSSEEVECNKSTITVSNIPTIAPSRVTHINLYRIGGLSDRFTLIESIPVGVLTTITDGTKDKDATLGKVLDSVNHTPPIQGLKHLTYRQGRLYASKGNVLYFSDLGDLDSWGCYNTIPFTDDITGIGTNGETLLVFTADRTYLISGNDPTTFAVLLASDNYGCINHRTIDVLKGGIVWVSKRGINSFANGVLNITQETMGDISITDSVNGEVYNDMYHVSLTSKWGEQTLVVDYRSSPCMRTISPNGFFVRYPDGLYLISKGTVRDMYKGNKLPVEYSTGMIGEAGTSMLKNYKALYIHYECEDEMYLRLLLDTARGIEVVNEYKLDPKRNHATLQFKDSIDGYGIQLNIKGVGIVHEMALTPHIREAR